ncbi:MAG: anti-sigma factor, partial [Planctomycetota bacterium]
MQRKEAEKLLAALIFDDLDEASKTELLTYLQTDNELRERLADMRMAVKVASDTVQHGPDPVLGKRRLKRLARLARHHSTRPTFFTAPHLAAAAAIFIIAAVGLIGIHSLGGGAAYVVTQSNERDVSLADVIHAETPSESPGKQTPEDTSTRGKFVLHSGARRPEVVDKGYAFELPARGPGASDLTVAGLPETAINGTIQNDSRNLTIDDFETIAGAQISSPHGYAYLPTKPVPTERWDSESSFEGKLPGGTASREGLMETDRKARIEDLME